MKMMDCSVLKTMVVNHKPIELIDVRSKNKFAAAHIPRARSLPFGELAAPKIFRRLHPTKNTICIISDGGDIQASLATGILRSAGYLNAVPLDGGMKDWMARGCPVRRKRFSADARAYLRTAALPVIGAAAAAALNEPIAATLLLAIAAVLLLAPKCSRGKRVRQSSWIARKHAIEDFS
jgi:rhodanese-related sulfurtransferase